MNFLQMKFGHETQLLLWMREGRAAANKGCLSLFSREVTEQPHYTAARINLRPPSVFFTLAAWNNVSWPFKNPEHILGRSVQVTDRAACQVEDRGSEPGGAGLMWKNESSQDPQVYFSFCTVWFHSRKVKSGLLEGHVYILQHSHTQALENSEKEINTLNCLFFIRWSLF